jgi:hypothetical protein
MTRCENDIKIDSTRIGYKDTNLTDKMISSERIHWRILGKLSWFNVKGKFVTCHSLSEHKKGTMDSNVAENRKSSSTEMFT